MLRVASTCVVLAAASVAIAEPRKLVVIGDACDATSLADDVAKLGGQPFTANARASVHVELISPSAAHVTFDDGTGQVVGPRELSAVGCAQLLASVALVIAMTPSTTPAAAATPPATPTLQLQPESHPTSDSTSVARAFEVTAPQTTSWDAIVGGATSVDTHGIVGAISAGMRYRRGTHSLWGDVRFDFPERDELAVGRVDVMRAQIELAPCQHIGAFAACAVIAAGALRGSGIGLAQERAVLAPLAAIGGRLAWEQPLGHSFAALVQVDALVLATTTRFDVDAMTVWTSPRVEAIGGLSLLARFL